MQCAIFYQVLLKNERGRVRQQGKQNPCAFKKGGLKIIRVERSQKNQMRAQLEEIVETYRSIQERVEAFKRDTQHVEYKKLWLDLLYKNDQQIQSLSRFMVTKCNR